MNDNEERQHESLPSVASKPKLLLPKDIGLRESIERVLVYEESTTLIGFWGRYNPLTPKKRGRPFTKNRGGNIIDGEKEEKY